MKKQATVSKLSQAESAAVERLRSVQQDEAAAEWVAPSALRPWADNPRKNDGEPVARVAESIKRFGFGAPIVARRESREIIAGHTRWKASQLLKLERVPVRFLDITEREAHLLALADNRLTELTEWSETLGTVLSHYDLQDVEMAGWDQTDLDKMAADLLRGDDVVDDDVPEPPANPVTKPGDGWALGRHRLVCGDSTDAATVQFALGGVHPFIMVTDPPYGVEYNPEWRKEAGINNSQRMGVVKNDDVASWGGSYKLFTGSVAYVWHSSLHIPIVAADIDACGFERRSLIIWRKPALVISRGHYHWQHEPCWYAVREGASAKWVGDRKQSTIWDISRKDGSEETVHSTQKAVECMARPIRNHGGKEDHVYDPFLGSGTTLIAAEQLDRSCFGLELNPAYCDVIVERWQSLTGLKARRIEGGNG